MNLCLHGHWPTCSSVWFAALIHWSGLSLLFFWFRFFFATFLLPSLLPFPFFPCVFWSFSSNMVPVLCFVPYASSPSGSRGGQHFLIQSCTTKFRNCVRYRQTTSSCQKSNMMIYKNRFSKMLVMQPLLSAQVPSGTPSSSGDGGRLLFLSCKKKKVRNCVRYRQTTSSCRKINPTIYKHQISTVFLFKLLLLLMLKALIILFILNSNLSKTFTLDGTIFRRCKTGALSAVTSLYNFVDKKYQGFTYAHPDIIHMKNRSTTFILSFQS